MADNLNDTLFSADEYLNFPDESKTKLARFLSEGEFDTDISVQELKLFRLAAGRLRHESLDSACKELEQQYGMETNEMSIPSNRFACMADCQSVCSTARIMEHYKQAYSITFVKDRKDEAKATVYDVIGQYFYVAALKKGLAKHCISVCRWIQDDSPYILMRADSGKREKLRSYDLILNKWKKVSTSREVALQPYLVEINKCVYMFGGKSLDIRRFSSCKWQPSAALLEHVFNPVYIAIHEKLTIFDGRTIQVFDSSTNKVKKFDSVTIPVGVAVNINNYACVITQTNIFQFDETTETCTLRKLNSSLMKDDVLIAAISHKTKVHIITQNRSLCAYTLSLEDLSITNVCSMERLGLSRDFSILASCTICSHEDYVISPFLDYEGERRRKVLCKP